MVEMILEPYAVKQRWRLPGKDPDWAAFLRDYLHALAGACKAYGSPIIGHIKALALFPEGGYFRISVVAAGLPATEEGSLPPQLPLLDLTINLIVYGLERHVLQQLTDQTSRAMAEKYHGEVMNDLT